ncbi:helix-turn-helix transcriptional regulator [Microbacterium oryzae]|uniref:helix-turn-helix domain-containing protein n=1 Tax=Microbacterium oryzae TaxID=743009 RepID=UPI0025B1FE1B|nr:helix-turn-helix transcriptional regulator [Microbacterium oryzae]MDN3309595.1 helix-turn-helix transcriptional regulator [Microbacterium oryzae]
MASNGMSAKAAKVVRKALEDQNRTQEWLAAATGIPMRTLARRLHKTNPSDMSLEELDVIASALGTDVVSLLVAARKPQSQARAAA